MSEKAQDMYMSYLKELKHVEIGGQILIKWELSKEGAQINVDSRDEEEGVVGMIRQLQKYHKQYFEDDILFKRANFRMSLEELADEIGTKDVNKIISFHNQAMQE